MLRAQPVPQAFQDAAAQYLDTVGYRDNDLFSKTGRRAIWAMCA